MDAVFGDVGTAAAIGNGRFIAIRQSATTGRFAGFWSVLLLRAACMAALGSDFVEELLQGLKKDLVVALVAENFFGAFEGAGNGDVGVIKAGRQ